MLLLILTIVVAVLGTVGAGVLFYASSYYRFRSRMYERLPQTAISDLEPGRAKVIGKVVAPARMMASPVLGTPCVYFRIVIEKRQQQDENLFVHSHKGIKMDVQTDLIVEDSRSLKFLLDDGTGRVEVDLDRADVEIIAEERTQQGSLKDCKEPYRSRLEKIYSKPFDFSRQERYEELVIQPGDEVLVLGRVRQGEAGQRVIMSGNSPLTITDEVDEARVLRQVENAKQARVGGMVLGIATGVATLILGVLTILNLTATPSPKGGKRFTLHSSPTSVDQGNVMSLRT